MRWLCFPTEHWTGNKFKIDGYYRGLPRHTVNRETAKKPVCRQKTSVLTNQFNMYLLKPDVVLVDGDLGLKLKTSSCLEGTYRPEREAVIYTTSRHNSCLRSMPMKQHHHL